MARKFKGKAARKQKKPPQRTGRRLTTWTRDTNAPFSESEYPFERALDVGEYSELLQMDMGPGLIIHPSTICLSRQDSHDSTTLAFLGEHFREFFPGEMPWLLKSTEQMCEALMLDARDEDDVEELNDTLGYFAEKGFLELDLSTPGEYRYRLNVEAVRQAKNACFRPMNELERIVTAYPQRFPDVDMQELAFALICDRDRYLAGVMLNLWHISLRMTPWMARHVDGRLWWQEENTIRHYLPTAFSDQARVQQALARLRKKGLVQLRQQGPLREYRPNASQMWSELDRLPAPLPDIASLGGYLDDGNDSPGPEE